MGTLVLMGRDGQSGSIAGVLCWLGVVVMVAMGWPVRGVESSFNRCVSLCGVCPFVMCVCVCVCVQCQHNMSHAMATREDLKMEVDEAAGCDVCHEVGVSCCEMGVSCCEMGVSCCEMGVSSVV